MVKQEAASRLSRERWIGGALKVIGESGLEAVAVEPLAVRLGVTKGSFYWHFASRNELISAVLETWEEHATAAVIAHLAPIADPTERLRAILAVTMVYGDDERAEVALLGSAREPLVAAAIGRVNSARIAFLTEIFTDLGHLKPVARVRARVAYSAYLGHLTLQAAPGGPRIPSAAARDYVEQFVAMLLAP
jgi:AcrR family transcriptional regulator